MKNLRVILFLIFLLAISTTIFAENPPNKKKTVSYEGIEKTLLIGLNSDNLGLKISCAYMLGEIKSKKSVDDLVEFIDTMDNDKARLTAVLALLKIASSENIVLLNQKEKSNEISELCERLMNCHSCLTDISNPLNRKEEVSVVSD